MKKSEHVRQKLIVALLLASASLTACATRSVKMEGTASAGAAAYGSSSTTEGASGVIGKDVAAPPNDLADSDADLVGIPIEVNRLVLKWIDYFQGSGRPHMERYLSRSTRYTPIMKEILRKEGLPEDLIYIALIESGFSSTAHSSASAVGYWQFIRGTGKRYGLRIDSFVDDRRDFVLATRAAADYFKGLYNLFGAWYLAIASYNVGENRVKNLVMTNKTRDFWKLARENRLPQETVNYVPKFLAARLIAKEPEKYGFTDIDYLPALEFSTVEFESPVDIRRLATEMGLEYDDLRDLNPAYKRGVAPMPRGAAKLVLRVPKGHEAKALAAAQAAKAGQTVRYIAEDDYSFYRVRRGDTISSIARRFNISQVQILRLNRLSQRSVLNVGKRLRLPSEDVATLGPAKSSQLEIRKKDDRTPASPKGPQSVRANERGIKTVVRSGVVGRVAKKNVKSAKAIAKQTTHVVRRGENLATIARKYQVSVRELASHNRLKNQSVLFVGKRLEIPGL
jgi:membrane-bound lytic murein transglycosylase D